MEGLNHSTCISTKIAQLVHKILYGKSDITSCGLHGYNLVSALFQLVNAI